MPVRGKKKRNGPAIANQGFLQPAKTASTHMASHDYAHPPPPILPILLAQNLPSKWIPPTDNPVQSHEQVGVPTMHKTVQ